MVDQLPTSIDADYPDDPDRLSVKQHQQHHDSLHQLNNVFYDAVSGTLFKKDGPNLVPINVDAGDTVATTQTVDNATGQMVARGGGVTASVAANESTTSTSFTDLTTVGPEVIVSLNEAREVMVVLSAQLKCATDDFGAFMSFAVSGATTRAAENDSSLIKYGTQWVRASAETFVSLNAGTNTLTAKYLTTSTSHAGSFLRRTITVVPL